MLNSNLEFEFHIFINIKPFGLGSRIRDVDAFWYKTEIFLSALTAQTARTEEFMFQNVAYWPTVYRTGIANKRNPDPIFFFISRILWNILLKIHEIIDKVGQYVCSWQSPKLERGQFLSPYFSWYLTFLWDFLACWYISQTPL